MRIRSIGKARGATPGTTLGTTLGSARRASALGAAMIAAVLTSTAVATDPVFAYQESGGTALNSAAILGSSALSTDQPNWQRGADRLPASLTDTIVDFSALVPAPQAAASAAKAPAPASPATPDEIFGAASIAVAHLAIEARWRSIAPLRPDVLFGARCTASQAVCDSPLMHAWVRLRAHFAGGTADRLEILRRVNAEVNAAIRYRSDTDNYGVPDYWASPSEVARRGSGDCKEFALAKMWMLAAFDIPSASMRIVVVQDTRNGLGHAILSVSMGGTNYVLDNMASDVRTDRSIAWYQPLYSVNTIGSWIHGMRRPSVASHTAIAPVSTAAASQPVSLLTD